MKPHRIFASIVIAFALLLAAAMLPTILAHAQQPPSKCGAYATGIRADGSTWTGAASRMWVTREGRWAICQPWVRDGDDPEMTEAQAAALRPEKCPDMERWEEWEGPNGEQCSSMPPGAYTGNTHKLFAVEVGRARLIKDEWGPVQGMLLVRCMPGKVWKRDGAFCSRVQ